VIRLKSREDFRLHLKREDKQNESRQWLFNDKKPVLFTKHTLKLEIYHNIKIIIEDKVIDGIVKILTCTSKLISPITKK